VWRYVVRRAVGAAIVLWLVSIFVFVAVRALPGDAVLVKIGESGRISEAQLDAARRELGLDDPVMIAYAKWAGGFVRGDLGDSVIQEGMSVNSRIRKALTPTLELSLLSAAIGLPLAIGLGVISGLRQDTWLDYPLRLAAILSLSVPNFVIAVSALTFLSRRFAYAPPFGWVDLWDDPLHNLEILLLPVLISGFSVSGTLMRMTRSSVLEVMRQDYVRTARAKGLAARDVIWRHILRNALISVTTLLGITVAFMLSGSVIMEVIFAIPGVGRLTLTAIQQRDYTQIMGNTMFFAAVVLISNLAVDMLYGVIDPRVKLR